MEFEPEPTQSSRFEAGAGAAAGRAGRPEPRAASHNEKVEATEHVVERGENFYTISCQYWGSGRYYRALWKANQANHPDIKVLHVGDVIVVPAIEDLDPEYILPSRTSAPAESLADAGNSRRPSQGSRASDLTDSAEDSPSSRSRAATTSAKVGLAASGSGNIPARRASRLDQELDLPESGTASRTERKTPYKGRSSTAASVFDGESAGDDPAAPNVGAPCASSAARPAYRVRNYDTLRSIAP